MGVGLVWRCQGLNGPNLAEFPSFSNFACVVASLGVEHDPLKVFQLTTLEKLDSFAINEFLCLILGKIVNNNDTRFSSAVNMSTF